MDVLEAFNKKKILVEENTGCAVILKKHNERQANSAAWIKWGDMNTKELPKIRYVRGASKIDLLHELVHIENFFIKGYWLVGRGNDPRLGNIDKIFKQIPEDFVVNNQINDLGINPISKTYRVPRYDNIKEMHHRDIAAKLTFANTFLEFNRKLTTDYYRFERRVDESDPDAYHMAKKAIDVLSNANYKESTNNNLINKLIKIFAPTFEKSIFPVQVIKENGIWNLSE